MNFSARRLFKDGEEEKTKIQEDENAKKAQAAIDNTNQQLQAFQLLATQAQNLSDENTIASKVAGVSNATISTFVGANKALELPPPASFITMAATIAVGLANVQKILTAERGGVMKRFARGGASYMGILGGNSHASGGTKFWGEDGTRFEAEKGELIAVVNKRNTDMLSRLSDLNSFGGHGDAFAGRGGTFLQAGGFAERNISASFDPDVMTNVLSRALMNLPAGQIEVVEIATGLRNAEVVEQRATG